MSPKPRRGKEDPIHLIEPQREVELVVDAPGEGMRLDAFLAVRLKWRSRASVQRMLEERRVTVNGERHRRTYRVKAGDSITIPLPEPPPEAFEIGEIPLDIIFEDEYLVVLNKQPGVVVHPTGKYRYDTLINALHLRYRRPDQPEKDVIPKLAHRLDRETSGVLIVCKTDAARRQLTRDFNVGRVRKKYVAIVEGEPKENEFTIDLPLGRDDESKDSSRQRVQEDGAAALTRFAVVETFGNHSFVHAFPETGRQHQIRVHLSAAGHPILCDKLYGKRRRLAEGDLKNEPGRGECILDRQALHCAEMGVNHPITGEEISFEAPLPADMSRVLSALRGKVQE